jgi:hypothetical protein
MQRTAPIIPIYKPENPKETAAELSQLKGLVYAFSLPARKKLLNNIKKKLETGHITVSLELIKRAIQESPSLRGRGIDFTNHLINENDVIKKFFVYAVDHPFSGLIKIFFPHPNYWFRGFEDFLQLANVPFSAITGTCETLCKIAAALITPSVAPYWRHLISKKQKDKTTRVYWLLLLLLTLPLWPIGQSLFFVGNAFGYARRIVDASCNIVSSSLAALFDLSRTNKRYDVIYPPIFPSIRILLKNELLFIPAELVLASALFPAGEVATFIVSSSPTLAHSLSSLAKALGFITTPIVNIVHSIFKHLNVGESLFAGGALSSSLAITSQLWSSSINTLTIKMRHHPWWQKITGNVQEEEIFPPIHSHQSANTATNLRSPRLSVDSLQDSKKLSNSKSTANITFTLNHADLYDEKKTGEIELSVWRKNEPGLESASQSMSQNEQDLLSHSGQKREIKNEGYFLPPSSSNENFEVSYASFPSLFSEKEPDRKTPSISLPFPGEDVKQVPHLPPPPFPAEDVKQADYFPPPPFPAEDVKQADHLPPPPFPAEDVKQADHLPPPPFLEEGFNPEDIPSPPPYPEETSDREDTPSPPPFPDVLVDIPLDDNPLKAVSFRR